MMLLTVYVILKGAEYNANNTEVLDPYTRPENPYSQRMEVCVDSVVSAVNASRGGASRLELCVALSEGGLTPTPGLLEIVKSCVHIPVFVMLRPRPGADFVYSPEEARIIKCDAAVLKKHGADGFVFGALTASGLIDEILCKDIVEIVAPLPVTFHRAIDVVRNPVGSMETIIQLGFTRILTSGGERTAYAGLQIIRELMVASMGRITIVPASGINSDNLGPILEVTGAREFHVSGRVPLKISWNQSKCKMGTGDDDTIYVTSYDVVARFCGNIVKVEGKEKEETSNDWKGKRVLSIDGSYALAVVNRLCHAPLDIMAQGSFKVGTSRAPTPSPTRGGVIQIRPDTWGGEN
uniref:Copper homeostasis protein cutC homolog n=1 Tax=Timema genevievae TaxID=629358 RepID=A0A7R9PMB5_TIMGE|nr:unnamed protein product [Timema genevievae]